jgi:hypothetical protein
MHAISGRTAAGRVLIAWKRALVADLGGAAAISPEQMARVEVSVRTRLLLDHVDAHLLGLGSLVSRRGRLKPIVDQRNRLAALLDSQLEGLRASPRTKAERERADYEAFLARYRKPQDGPGATR